ncbi:MAG: J domain-containing protein [Oscillospiraceae bacterium]|nr:J domain-containing protein [Oscillospiraceae bacterium]
MNPYEVLGIDESADEAAIKKAYRELVKKYHPDQYKDHPLSDLAGKKLAEVNEAYGALTKSGSAKGRWGGQGRQGGAWPYDWDDGFQGDGHSDDGGDLGRAEGYIRGGNYEAAEATLSAMQDRPARWHYLMAHVMVRKGWYDQAIGHAQTAVQMEPSNAEYRSLLNRFASNANAYRAQGGARGYRQGPDLCTVCQCIWCTECCCSMGDCC